MKDGKKAKQELVSELARLRQKVAKLEKSDAQRKRVEEELKQNIEKLRRTMKGTIYAMALTVEMRDPYTAGHQRNMAQLSTAIAREMGLSAEEVEGVSLASTIHDVGRTSIPIEILSKPSRLSEVEFLLVKRHPQVGYDILSMVEFPWPIAQIVLQHHERMDGSGYPEGLSGEEILLEARILAVADVVEAMASHRPYRPAHGIDKALEELSKNKGKRYDPTVVDACLTLFRGKEFAFRKDEATNRLPH